MKPIGRIILEAADRSEYYPLSWDQTTAAALLAGTGVLRVQQGGKNYTFTSGTVVAANDIAPSLAIIDTTAVFGPVPAGSLGEVIVALPDGSTGGWVEWHSTNDADTPPTITVKSGTATPS